MTRKQARPRILRSSSATTRRVRASTPQTGRHVYLIESWPEKIVCKPETGASAGAQFLRTDALTRQVGRYVVFTKKTEP